MNIIVVGCGKIGSALVKSLVSEGHDVVAVDSEQSAITDITNIFDVMTVCGDAIDRDTLSEAGVDKARLFIAVTDSDEVNMLSCLIARRMGARHTIARVRKPKYSAESLGYLRSQLDLSLTLNPEQLAAHDIYNILRFPSAVNIEKFSAGSLEMVELHLEEGSPFDSLSLSEIRSKFSAKFLVCAVRRGDGAYIPDGNFVLKSGDRVGLVATPHEFTRLLKQMGVHRRPIKSVMVLGAGRISHYLTELLTEAGISVKVIEKDERVAKSFASSLHKAVVICGDGAGQELLREEGIRSVDAFVALTGTDEQNILISTFAQSENRQKVITKVNRSEFLAIAERLGLDSIVSSKTAVCDVVVSYARALQNSMGSKVDTVYQLMDEKVEALEFEVRPDFKYINIPLKELETKKNVLIAGIIRKRETVIPSGNDVILPSDKVIVFSAGHRLGDLSDIIK